MSHLRLGQVVATRALHVHMQRYPHLHTFCMQALRRHRTGDWGEVCEHDRQVNDDALTHGGRLVSVYKLGELPEVPVDQLPNDRIWIITEADRSATTVLYPSDY